MDKITFDYDHADNETAPPEALYEIFNVRTGEVVDFARTADEARTLCAIFDAAENT